MAALDSALAIHGWTAVYRDPKVLLSGKTCINEPSSLLASDIYFPAEDDLVVKVQAYAKEKLPLPTYHHSMRVFYFGASTAAVFPAHVLFATLRSRLCIDYVRYMKLLQFLRNNSRTVASCCRGQLWQ